MENILDMDTSDFTTRPDAYIRNDRGREARIETMTKHVVDAAMELNRQQEDERRRMAKEERDLEKKLIVARQRNFFKKLWVKLVVGHDLNFPLPGSGEPSKKCSKTELGKVLVCEDGSDVTNEQLEWLEMRREERRLESRLAKERSLAARKARGPRGFSLR
ncbi:uncharacterized protein LY89DRAFT_789397 [Mollisia scopiformis]|uniref:Uncharacterized protein n=1 Tax=Mollisia scopiformis TaxID=149040 RepID=A0A132B676_MOLSC|nr:uncharacterized protein LY89DRAFT_789397 [Mollisia scopiformis]KUJ07916.1 hypothetical protein LY89DRAFT_789397 [Mollisia scopiformis]